VQIDLHEGENILRITASRSGVDQAVEEIERLLNEMTKMTVDLSPIRATTGNRLSAKAISTAAESSGSVVETSHAGDTVSFTEMHSRTYVNFSSFSFTAVPKPTPMIVGQIS